MNRSHLAQAGLLLIVLLGSTPSNAQQLLVPSQSTPPSGEKVPTIRTTPPDTAKAASTWGATVDGGSISSATITVNGPSLHVSAGADTTVASAMDPVAGRYTARATFRPLPGNSGAYGLTLGGKATSPSRGIAFLVRPDRQWAVQQPADGVSALQDWTPLPANVNRGGVDIVEVRVTATDATLLVNGSLAGRVVVAAGLLDGRPGVFVASGGDVQITALTIETSAAGVPK